jgi:hypothetical protein
VSGIVNDFAQEHSYVRHVTFINFESPALVIGSGPPNNGAADSGPYEDLYFLHTVGVCVTLNSGFTRGIHNTTCVGNSPPPTAGVLLDGANNYD